MNKNDFFNFTDDSCGIKSGLFLIGLLLIGIIIWNLLGLSGGRGGGETCEKRNNDCNRQPKQLILGLERIFKRKIRP
jgi:hypothetical protein